MDNREFEKRLNNEGYNLIAGCDEVGRGCIAGPVYACAIIMPNNSNIEGVTDSKKLTDKKRRILKDQILKEAISYAVVAITNQEIDEINILEASRKAMEEALKQLDVKPNYILTDAMPLLDFFGTPIEALIKGDAKAQCIAAASILAKVTRDRIMDEFDKQYPDYCFKKHKGYPTKQHLELLEKYGPIKEHYRYSYGPVKKFLSK